MQRMSFYHRLAVIFACFVIIGVLGFLWAWHQELQAEAQPHTGSLQVTSDTASDTQSLCGNGKIDPSEECDDGNDVPFDGCTRCLIDGFYTCSGQPSVCERKSTRLSGCGDGILQAGEECDDGNGRDGDGCSYRCEIEPGYVCPDGRNCHKRPPCGDGIIESGEQCDDGNSNDYDGCNSACQIEHYYTCTGTPSVCTKTNS
ncbi:MAG TPA: DUF4215 domain-containing protein [Candidatus Peribacteraceae bacterium]|nr:DUF4215 domain-containing protein [Candidatus Peribacteraceae bacterium]